MIALGIIIARAGSKGLPDKCMRALLGRPVIAYTFDHARESRLLTDVVFTTDSRPAQALARQVGIEVIERPPELATDTATVDAAARHAVECWEHARGTRVDVVVLLYGNIPVRAPDLIDRALEHLHRTGADSVRSVAPVTKQHPDWVHRLDGDRLRQFRPNSIYRRQDLEPLYYHDGAVCAVTRRALFAALERPDDHQAFLGADRRALIQACEDAVDIDGPLDLALAEAILRFRAGDAAAAYRPAPPPVGTVRISQRDVGPGLPVFIVAEAGVNHDGSREKALALIDAAVEAGADAVKFQLFRTTDLVTAAAGTAAYQCQTCGTARQRDLLTPLELDGQTLTAIRARCTERSLPLIVTPFSPAAVEQAGALGVAALKIASTDLDNHPLLDAAGRTSLPIILSTGAATAEEIERHVGRLLATGLGDRLILLHCVSCYPTPLESANLGAIAELTRRFRAPCGFSDHTTSVHTGGWAVAAGACILEKHFTLDRGASGPDHALSLKPTELAEYVRRARDAQTAVGTGALGMTALEADVRASARRSIVSHARIAAGTTISAEMLTLKRPGTGIPPDRMPYVVGRSAVRDIPPDTLLTWDMLQ
ncbi:MAG TPA: N-acetylneuraminate synthase family protein [Phycisphaerae bacterium]|nr:N-acetylneuraminate synthase family protein [Phycisphaerae bacterium]HNU45000.1 N-acetylneuraminate synthase family protein [Phycisphaerae bacterium]